MSAADRTREALADLIQGEYDSAPELIADAILASPWLAALVAAVVEAERERIADAIEAVMRQGERDAGMASDVGEAWIECADIARGEVGS